MRDAIPVYVHLLRAKNLIDRRYAEQLEAPALARAAHASTAHFSRSFKRAFGETPHAYLLRRRLERATELLRGTELSVTEVSVEAGFQSLASFSAAFRDLVGEAPSEYARRWRESRPLPAILACFHDDVHAPRNEQFSRSRRDALGLASPRDLRDRNPRERIPLLRTKTDQPDHELILLEPGPPMMGDEAVRQVKELVAKGGARPGRLRDEGLQGGVPATLGPRRDVPHRADGALLRIEATFRDNSGNWFSMTQPG